MNSMAEALWSLYRNQKAKGLRAAMRQTLQKMEKAGLNDAAWYNAMGELSLDERNPSLSLRFFQQACAKSDEGEYWLNQGHAHYALRDYTEAEKVYRHVLEKHSDDAHAMVNLCNCLIHRGQWDEAWAICEDGLKHTFAKPALWNTQGQIAYLRRQYSQALELFSQAYREAPDYIDALFNQANIEAKLGQRLAAIQHLEQCTRKDENYEGAYFNLALLYLEEMDYQKARTAVQKALSIHGNQVEYLHLLGRIYLLKNELKLARETFHKALRVQDDHIASTLGLARVMAQEAQEEEALSLVKRALAMPNLTPEDQKNALSVLLDLGQFALALMYCERAGEEAKSGLGLIHTLCLWKTGKVREAIARLENVLLEEGESVSALTLLGMMLREHGAAQLAEPRLRRALELDGGNPRLVTELALTFSQLERHEEAILCLQKALEIHPHHPDLLYNLACAQTKAGNRDDALVSLQKALESGFSDLDQLEHDPDMQSLRQLKAFSILIGETE